MQSPSRAFAGSVCLLIVLFCNLSARAQHYSVGSTGTFGLPVTEGWNYFAVPQYMNSLDDATSASFTAMESVTVDRVKQFYADISGTVTAQVTLQGDDGSGHPNGIDLVTPSSAFTPAGGSQTVQFGSSYTLVPGNVYHIVTKPVSLSSGAFFDVRSASGNNPIRPFDRALDPAFHDVNQINGGAWTPVAVNPWFSLANGSDANIVEGPGQTYLYPSVAYYTQGDGGAATGERFTITDKEVPVGLGALLTQVNFAAYASGVTDPTHTLKLQFRDAASPGVVLAEATMTPAQADGTYQNFTLNTPLWLAEGTTYLFTTQFGVPSSQSTAGEFYFVPLYQSDGGGATWGGATTGVPAFSAGGNNWSSPSFGSVHDVNFSFEGRVVPEPASAAMLAGLSLVLMKRRRGLGITR